MDQDKTYRRRKEVEEWKDKGPIKRIEKIITKRNILRNSQIKQIQAKTLSKVNSAVNKALESNYPSTKLLQDFIGS
jgi:TPP-dependent pyruvate/acetoin dehydrogenase alpha subunit